MKIIVEVYEYEPIGAPGGEEFYSILVEEWEFNYEHTGERRAAAQRMEYHLRLGREVRTKRSF